MVPDAAICQCFSPGSILWVVRLQSVMEAFPVVEVATVLYVCLACGSHQFLFLDLLCRTVEPAHRFLSSSLSPWVTSVKSSQSALQSAM